MKFLSFGSLNLDHIYRVTHHVKTGETLQSVSLETLAGGKGLNQSVALKRAGAEVYHAGAVGADGGMLIGLLEAEGVDTGLVRTVSCPTGHAVIQVNDEGDNCILLYPGANRTVTEEQADEVLARFVPGDVLVLQNEISCLSYLITKAYEKGLTVVLNPSPMEDTILKLPLEKVSVLLLNKIEGAAIAGCESVDEIANRLTTRFPDTRIVLTLGSNGSVYCHGDERVYQLAFRVNAVDTTAAGDTYTGYFLHAVMNGKTAAEAMRIASAASAIAVTRKGAAPSVPRAEEVKKWLAQHG